MRVAPPSGLRLSADTLLADVRDRLATRLPAVAARATDATDPGWILLEQAAWMVEQLSSQLDAYPLAIVQQFLHLLGGRVLPARPALGVVAMELGADGVLDGDPTRPATLRLFTQQSERSEMVEFTPAERGVSFRRMRVASISRIVEGELRVHGALPADGLAAWLGALQPSTAFARERVRYRLVAANVPELKDLLASAIKRLGEARVGWLRLEVTDEDNRGVTVVAHVDPSAAFRGSAPTGFTQAGDLVGEWATLDDSNWTPSIHLRDHPSVPVRLRGRAPMPLDEGRIVFPGVPANLPVAGLLTSAAAPLPTSVCVDIWTTLTHAESRLAEFRPVLQRAYPALGPNEPTWIAGAIDAELWHRFAPGPTTMVHLQLESGLGEVRVGLVVQGEDDTAPALEVFAQEAGGVLGGVSIPHRVAWRLPLPSREPGKGMVQVVALDIAVPRGTTGLLLAVTGPCIGALANPLLVIQAPFVRDGRDAPIERNVPTGVSLLHADIVGPEVLDDLLEEPLPADLRQRLRTLPLAWFGVTGGEPVVDFRGVSLDACSGELTLNGVDRRGESRLLRRGDAVALTWYRRTDGALGNVAAGQLRLSEQEAGPGPTVTRVENPLPTFYGTAREDDAAAMERLFGPTDAVPVLPADFESLFRQAIGTRGARWEVRVWAYAERALCTTALWPPPSLGVPEDAERARLAAELADAGPEKLLVLVGSRDGVLGAEDLDWARRVIRAVCARVGRRVPTVRDAVVGQLWALTFEPRGASPELLFPCFAVEGLYGTLTDVLGRAARVPPALLLNAAIFTVREAREG